MDDREQALIDILFDDSATISEKDDAAILLENFISDSTVNALLAKGKEETEDKTILNSIGESLGTIWIKRNLFDQKSYQSLLRVTRLGVSVAIKDIKPEWIKEYNLDNEGFKY
jgi:hypothetical protein